MKWIFDVEDLSVSRWAQSNTSENNRGEVYRSPLQTHTHTQHTQTPSSPHPHYTLEHDGRLMMGKRLKRQQACTLLHTCCVGLLQAQFTFKVLFSFFYFAFAHIMHLLLSYTSSFWYALRMVLHFPLLAGYVFNRTRTQKGYLYFYIFRHKRAELSHSALPSVFLLFLPFYDRQWLVLKRLVLQCHLMVSRANNLTLGL